MFITTDAYAAYSLANPTAWVDSMIAKVPEYTKSDLTDYYTGC
jgi:hypothetical protein